MIRQSWMFAVADHETEAFSVAVQKLFYALPGVQRLEFGSVSARSTGEIKASFILDVYFVDEDAMNAAFAAAEGKRISRELTGAVLPVIDVLLMENPVSVFPADQ